MSEALQNPRTLLVIGASSELGCALLAARARAEPEGCIIGHCHSGSARLEEIRKQVPELSNMQVLQADLTTREGAESLISSLRIREVVPHQVVYLPGLPLRYERFGQLDVDRFHADFTLQVHSFLAIARWCVPEMAARCKKDPSLPNAKLLCVCSSVVRGVPPRNTVAYTTVKYAQLGLVNAMAAEYAGQRVNINAVSPSFIGTKFLREIPAKALEVAAAQHPARRHATPADVIPTIEHLLSSASDYLTGVNIPITGGATS